MVSAPNRLSILGLGKRAPSEESNTLKSLPNACSALPTTKGARVMLSTPPATHTSASPQVMACEAAASALSPERHSLWRAPAGAGAGGPAGRGGGRAALGLSPAAWGAQPPATSSMIAGAKPERAAPSLSRVRPEDLLAGVVEEVVVSS